LHQYDSSPFAYKARLLMGFKKLAWRSVEIPMVMPKPLLMPLTGGYRKTPVMQIGADIYCDTSLIARVLDRVQPAPGLYPKGQEASALLHADWADHELFFLVIPILFQPAGLPHMLKLLSAEVMSKFPKDREQLFAGGSGRRPSGPTSKNLLPTYLTALDAQLATRPFLLDDTPSIADFATYHPVWFVRSNPGVASALDPYRNIVNWYERMFAFGHGQPEVMSGAEALEVARGSTTQDTDAGDMPDPNGLKIGDAVVISATDYGADPVKGVLVKSSLNEIAVRRSDERTGEVVVHFPRVGFKLMADKV
ncbi:MAG: glutathione S-transferase family protein, partial [Nevskiales bacterium]